MWSQPPMCSPSTEDSTSEPRPHPHARPRRDSEIRSEGSVHAHRRKGGLVARPTPGSETIQEEEQQQQQDDTEFS